MSKYILSFTKEIEAEDEEDAKNKLFKEIEETPQETITTYLYNNLISKETDKRSFDIWKILNKMIDELENAGVDTSYFPEEANKILEETSNKLNQFI